MWWETIPAQITLWGTAILTGVALLRKVARGASRLTLALHILSDKQKWPNGSTDLVSALQSIYSKQQEFGEAQTRLLEEVKSLAQNLEQHITVGHRP